jgi:rhodanese-related sulfurtransferase
VAVSLRRVADNSAEWVVLDLRPRDEVEQYPYIIPGALLTTEVDLAKLVGWLPPRTWLVLYATDRIPQTCSHLRLLRDDLSFYVLTGGLRAWWDANLEMDSVDHCAGGLRTRG